MRRIPFRRTASCRPRPVLVDPSPSEALSTMDGAPNDRGGPIVRALRAVRPSPATVIASIALLVALAGTGYAASSLPANSVGNKQLQADAVTSSKVKDHSLLNVDFARNQIPRGAGGAPGSPGPPGSPGTAGARGPTGLAGPSSSGLWAVVNDD